MKLFFPSHVHRSFVFDDLIRHFHGFPNEAILRSSARSMGLPEGKLNFAPMWVQ